MNSPTAMPIDDVTISLHAPDAPTFFDRCIGEYGLVVVEDAYNPDELEALRDAVLALEARATREDPAFVYQGDHLWAVWNLYERSPTLMRLALLPEVFGLMADAAAEPMEFARATMMKKTPGATQRVGWHQDLAIAVDRDLGDAESCGVREGVPHRWTCDTLLQEMFVARINLEPQYADGGCLQVVPGSHRWRRLSADACVERIGQSTPTRCPVPAGSVLFYKPLLAHASGPNTRSDARHQRRVLHNEFRPASATPNAAADWYPWEQSACINHEGILFRRRGSFPATTGRLPARYA